MHPFRGVCLTTTACLERDLIVLHVWHSTSVTKTGDTFVMFLEQLQSSGCAWLGWYPARGLQSEGADFLDSEDPGKYLEEELAPTALPAGLRLRQLQGHDSTSRLWDP